MVGHLVVVIVCEIDSVSDCRWGKGSGVVGEQQGGVLCVQVGEGIHEGAGCGFGADAFDEPGGPVGIGVGGHGVTAAGGAGQQKIFGVEHVDDLLTLLGV